MFEEPWVSWLPADFGTLWLVCPERDRLWEKVARCTHAAARSMWVVGPVAPDRLGHPHDTDSARLRRHARWAGPDPFCLAGRAEAQDLILWAAGTPREEAEWADLYRLLEQKGCYVLHWVSADPGVTALYRDYLIRPDTDPARSVVLDWDPELFR
jgi:hypothetical protein